MSTWDSSLYCACFEGDEQLVLNLANPDNVKYVDRFSNTPLHQACKQGLLDVVKLLIEKYGCDSNVTDKYHLSPLDYAKKYDKIDVVSYLQKIHSSLYWACAQGNKHLVFKLAKPDNVNCVHPDFGDTPLHRACRRGCLDIVVLLIEKYGCDPNVTNKYHESVLHYACHYGHIDIVHYLIGKQHLNPLLRDNIDQSEPLDCALNNNQTDIAVYLCQHCISSDEMLNPNRIKTTINLIRYILKASRLWLFIGKTQSWKTANGDNILQHVGGSKTFISHVSSAVVLEILNSGSTKNIAFKPDCKTSDGDNILELVCQSYIYLSQTPSALILKWLGDATINQVKKSIPDSKTADGKALIEIVCQSELYMSRISSAVLSKWLSDTTIIQTSKLAKTVIPEWKTADGDTLLQLVCQSKTAISSTVLTKWLSDSTTILDLIVTPDLRTADGVTLFQLICQSERCLIQISSVIFFKWLKKTPLEFVSVSIPDCKTANGFTLLQLILHSEMSLSQTSSIVLLKLLNNSRNLPINQMKMVDLNWKSLDGIHFLKVLFHSKVKDINVVELMQHYILKDGLNPDNTFLDSEGNTALHIACKTNKLAAVSYLIDQAHCDPNIKNKTGSMPLHLTSESEIIKILVDHGAKMTTDFVFKLILSKHTTDSGAIELFTLSVRKGTMLWNPKDSNNDGYTALHLACQANKLAVVSYLIDQAHCDPNIENPKGYLPLDMTTDPEIIDYLCQHDRVAVYSKTIAEWINKWSLINDATILCILKSLVDNHRYKTTNGSTLLHVVCTCTYTKFHAKISLIDFLLTKGHCDPNCLNSRGQMPLEVTSDSDIMKILVEHGARMTTDVVFKVISSKHVTESRAIELLALSIRKGTMLWNPTDLNRDGETALHLAHKLKKPAIVDCLLTEVKCNPNANNLLKSLLKSTTSLEIAKMLVKNGARITPKLVIRFEALEDTPKKHAIIKLMLVTWNPDDRGTDGYTALHLACKADSPTTVNLLLTVAHCDPNIKSSNEEVPLQMTTNTEIIKDLIRHGAKTSIMYESHQNSLGTNKPVQPPVKVFIIGNPSVGKSTLTAALKKKRGFIARIFSGKVSGVDKKTVGIVPHDIESDTFGRVTFYDFAGHREFYSGHAALLQTAIQSTPPIFLLVVNLCEQEDEIIKNILYWISFLENQCASVSCKPHIILVGSHADALKGINPKEKINTIVDSLKLNTNCFINMEYIGFVAMNCQYHESSGMSDLRHLLIKSCEELRTQEPITFNAHCFLVFLIDTFMNQTAVTIKDISEKIKNQQSKEGVLEFLPRGIEALYKICLELNDRGHILLLKDRIAAENSYVVIDKEFLLSKISGTMFAPDGFKQHKELSTNTGVVPLSKIKKCFPDKDLDILIGFLTHLEFCHEMSDQVLHQVISKQYSRVPDECYYLFPGLISVKADDSVWQMQLAYNYNFGWILKCIHLEQFFSSRFLQVLLLRLAFSFALESSSKNPNQSIGIHRNCYLWKNGIFWGNVYGMQILVEVTSDNKSVVLLARFQKPNLLQCVHHRSEVISTILECKEQFCPRVVVTESFVDSSSPLQYPLNHSENLNICSLQDLVTAVVSDCECPSVVFQCSTIPAENFLSFEFYLEMKLSTIQELWDEKNEEKIISETFLSTFIQKSSSELSSFIKSFTESSTSNTSEDQLYQDLLRWRDSDKKKQKTYKDLRQKVDGYSVFAGRNVLELTGKLPKLLIPCCKSIEKEKEEKQQGKLRVYGIKPKLSELQLLKYPDGNELRIIDTVTPKWKLVAIALGFDGPRIETIEMGSLRQPGDACLRMFIEWLSKGHDLTWESLIQSLKAANIIEIANLLSSTIEIEAEDAGARTLSTVITDTESQVAASITTPDVINNSLKVEPSKCENESLRLFDQIIDSKLTRPSQAEQDPSIATILNIKALEMIEGRGGRKVRVTESIGSLWEEVAKALDIGQEDIDLIKTRHSDNDEEACREMLATWLEGNNGEVSWTAFSQALIDAGLPELADSLKE